MSVSSDEQLSSCGSIPGEREENESTSSTIQSRGSEDYPDTLKETLSKKETESVFRLRVTVISVMLMAASAVTAIIFHITKSAATQDFIIQYDGVAQKVVGSFTTILKEMGATSGLGVAATAYAVDSKSAWPYVTLPDFQQRASNSRKLSQALFVSINPIVAEEEFDPWEKYVSQNSANYWM